MTTKQQKNLILKGVINSLFIALIFLLSWYGPRPFSVLGPWAEDLGKFYTRRRRLARFLSSLGPYSAAVFMLLQALQAVISPIPGTYLLTMQGASIGSGQYETAIIIAAISGVLVLTAYFYRSELYHWVRGIQ